MNFIINTDEIKAKGIPIGELLYLLALYLKDDIREEELTNLHNKGLVVKELPIDGHKYSISKKGITLVEQVLLNSEFKSNETNKGRYELLAEKLRELYPSGKKPGTNYQWRDSNAIIAKKLKALVKKYGETFTDEEAIDATKRYVESFNGNYQYMQLLKYFISKRKVIDGEIEESSQLLSFIENKEQVNTITDDWTTELK